MFYFSIKREVLSPGMLRFMLKFTYLLVLELRPDLLSTDIYCHSKSTLPFKTGADESWSHTSRWNCYLSSAWKCELLLLLGTTQGKTWISWCPFDIKVTKNKQTNKKQSTGAAARHLPSKTRSWTLQGCLSDYLCAGTLFCGMASSQVFFICAKSDSLLECNLLYKGWKVPSWCHLWALAKREFMNWWARNWPQSL